MLANIITTVTTFSDGASLSNSVVGLSIEDHFAAQAEEAYQEWEHRTEEAA